MSKSAGDGVRPRGEFSGRKRTAYLAGVLIDTVGSGFWMPVALIFFTRAQGVPVVQVGLALTIGGLAGLAIGPVGGALVDRWGAGLFVVLSNVLRAGVFLCYPWVDQIWMIAVLAMVTSASDRLFWTANTPLLGRFAEGRELDSLLGTQSVIRIVGLGLGAGLSGLFAGSIQGLHIIALGNAASYLVAAALVQVAVSGLGGPPALPAAAAAERDDRDVAKEAAARWSTVLKDRPYLLLCLTQLGFSYAAVSLTVILPLASIDPLPGPPWLPGASIVVGNTVLALIQKSAVAFSRRTSRLTSLMISCVLFAATFLILLPADGESVAAAVVLVLVASALGVVGEALFGPLMTAAAHAAAPPSMWGRYSAMYQTAWGIATVSAPALFTLLLATGYRVLWSTLAVMSIAILPVLRIAANRLPAGVLRDDLEEPTTVDYH